MTWLVLLIATLPTPVENEVLRDRCDVIEVNRVFDGNGKPTIQQLIFWQHDGTRLQVRAWRLLNSISQIPVRDWRTGEWQCLWHDGEFLREVRAGAYRETFTQYDVEVYERGFLPKERRLDLLRPINTSE